MSPQPLLSDLQLRALNIGWQYLGCDEEVDGLTNELMSDYFPLFEYYRRRLTQEYLELQKRDDRQQLQQICERHGWEESQLQDWFVSKQDEKVRFRDLLGNRAMYLGRFFDREAIGEENYEQAFNEISRALQSLARQDLIRMVGKLGYVLTASGISMAQATFPDIRPHLQDDPFTPMDDLSIRRMMSARRARPFCFS